MVAGIAAYRYHRKRNSEARARDNMEVLRQIISAREENQNRNNAAAANQGSNGGVTNQEDGDSEVNCRVCLQNPREVILLECGHIALCSGCAAQIMRSGQGCPICRSEIVRVMPAYLA